MTRRPVRSLLLGVLAAALLTAGCSAGGGGQRAVGAAATTSTTLRTAYASDIVTFDPDNGFELLGLGAIRSVYEGLVDYRPGTTTLVPRLASAWTVSPDGLTYTFTLRDGVVFHDGSPMTSADVRASFDRRADQRFVLSYFLAGVASTATPDPRTFVVRLKAAQPSFLDSLASPWGPKVVGPAALRDHAGDDRSGAWLVEHADGTGPFRLARFDRGTRYTLERAARYWGAAPALSQVQISIVPDVSQQVLQLRGGELDVVLHGYPYAQLQRLPQGLTASVYDDLGLELAFVNPKRRLKTPEQRQRVMSAIDPARWVGALFGRYARPAASLFPRAMLAPATPYAWPTAQDAGRVAVPELEIGYAAEEAGVQQRVADTLIARLRQAGISATARALPGGQVSTFLKDPGAAPDLYLAQNNPDSAHPDSQSSLFFATGGSLNIFGVSDPTADAGFAAAAGQTDRAARDAGYAEAARGLFAAGLFLPLADLQDVVVHRDGLTDLGTRPAVPWNIDFTTARWQG